MNPMFNVSHPSIKKHLKKTEYFPLEETRFLNTSVVFMSIVEQKFCDANGDKQNRVYFWNAVKRAAKRFITGLAHETVGLKSKQR